MTVIQSRPNAQQPCRIVLTEDDEPVRDRLAALLRDWTGGELVAVCANLAESIAAIETHDLCILITDLKLPDGNGIDAIRLLRQKQPDAEAMVISVLTDEATVVDAIEAGASGYLLKDADSTGLIEAITDVVNGRAPISSRIARMLVRRLTAGDGLQEKTAAGVLTSLEMDILAQIAKGFTNTEIAAHLEIPRQAVPAHVRNVYRKLESSNNSEELSKAIRPGLIRT